MSAQGWKPGQGLGARDSKHINSSPVPKLKISVKDDTLGLGATLNSQDPMQARTGLDAFQGLLGRLNGKSEVQIKKEVQKTEDRKLAMWAQGRWGGVMFVPGGTLVQGDGYKRPEDETEEKAEVQEAVKSQKDESAATEKAERKAERKRRKEERRQRRKAKSSLLEGADTSTEQSVKTDESVPSKEKKTKKRERPVVPSGESVLAVARSEEQVESAASPVLNLSSESVVTVQTATAPLRTGRHVIRGRNIQAKKMAFADMKMLDQVRAVARAGPTGLY